jgi:hypothetical protein
MTPLKNQVEALLDKDITVAESNVGSRQSTVHVHHDTVTRNENYDKQEQEDAAAAANEGAVYHNDPMEA